MDPIAQEVECVKQCSGAEPADLGGIFVRFVAAVCVDLPQQVLDATIVELVSPVTVLVQLTHLAHEEIRNLQGKTNDGMF